MSYTKKERKDIYKKSLEKLIELHRSGQFEFTCNLFTEFSQFCKGNWVDVMPEFDIFKPDHYNPEYCVFWGSEADTITVSHYPEIVRNEGYDYKLRSTILNEIRQNALLFMIEMLND